VGNAIGQVMNARTPERTDPVAYLRHALAEGQFSLFCQPIAAIAGPVAYPMAEVLIRLREEENALLPPGEFLPVLEHYGMMPELDRWVVGQVLRRLSEGSEIPRFTINVSAQTIADPTFPHFFANEIIDTGVPAERVLFEIDETDALAVPACVSRFSATIGSLGSGMLIDGYGRGLDGLAPLKVPCVQFIKVDRSVIRQLVAGEIPTAKVNAVLRVTSEIGIHLIAEGVEDLEVLTRLKAMNFRYAQGFGVCAPQPMDMIFERSVIRISEPQVQRPNFGLPAEGFFAAA
jgi:EAL domain-containing protein (putative c-di-GMP-specific phosphodiesterase class I)